MSNQVHAAIEALLDAIEADNKDRIEYEPAVTRAATRDVLGAIAWLYGARNGSAASIYAADSLQNATKAITW
ncbi:hypothetical protein [Sphingomonas sp. LT1P40]|uniref:hypothetical protein n=1 Tax=Alteristakelama amylovorans TaxID=3096166 RepID=UPI002FCBFAB2